MNQERIKEYLKKDIKKLTLNEYYKILAYFAGITFFVVFSFLIGSFFTLNIDNIVKLLVPFGVLLSAGLASVSVMKSIDNTNRIEREKEEKEHKKVIAQMDSILSHLSVKLENIRAYSDINALISEKDYLEKIIILLINNDKVMSLNEPGITNILIIIEGIIGKIILIDENTKEETIDDINSIKKNVFITVEKIAEKYNLINTKLSLEIIGKKYK